MALLIEAYRWILIYAISQDIEKKTDWKKKDYKTLLNPETKTELACSSPTRTKKYNVDWQLENASSHPGHCWGALEQGTGP